MALLGMSSLAVFAGGLVDWQIHSDQFMSEYQLEFVEVVDAKQRTQRFVASQDQDSPRVLYLPVNEQNSALIDGRWEITRINDQSGVDLYNKYENRRDQETMVALDFRLIGTGKVILDEDPDQVYRVSLLSEYNTILLFKEMNQGYEIVEAKKIIELPSTSLDPSLTAGLPSGDEADVVLPEGLRMDRDVYLNLERALHPSQSEHMLVGHAVSGSVSLVDGTIQNLSVSLTYENGKRTEMAIDYAMISDGGQFEAYLDAAEQESVHGIITNNGEGVFRIRFATGPLQGAMLNFVTDMKLDEMAEERYEEEDAMVEAEEFNQQYGNNTQEFNQSRARERSENAEQSRAEQQEVYDYAPYDQESDIDYEGDYDRQAQIEMMNQKVEESGFNFGGERSLASE